MKRTKLKLKKQVWVMGIIILFLIIGIYTFNNIYKDFKYKQTNEYKFLEIGYTKDEIKILEDNLDDKYINKLLNSEKNEFILSVLKEKFYLNSNLDKYIEYHNENNNLNSSEIVKVINTNNNYDHYEIEKKTDTSKNELMLVNKFYLLNENYKPELVNIDNKYYYGENHQTRQITYDAFINMWNAAYKENIYLIINSSFRDYKEQKKVYNYYKDTEGTTYADAFAARPGASEHQTGLALDIFCKTHTSTSNFIESPAYTWLTNNAYKYGFIERYQKDKENITGFSAESWHWRYVGIDAATYIHDNNITFDEYYAYFIEPESNN